MSIDAFLMGTIAGTRFGVSETRMCPTRVSVSAVLVTLRKASTLLVSRACKSRPDGSWTKFHALASAETRRSGVLSIVIPFSQLQAISWSRVL